MDAEGDYKYYKFQFTQAEAADSYMGFREVDLIGVDYTPVSDFNMLVILDENNATFKNAGFRHSLCQPNGEDLRFQSSAGAELKYEIASWNQSGKSIIWLNIPSLVRNEKITMRWGNSASATPSYVTDGSAWSNYMAVYHLDQAQGQNAPDSGPHNNHATMRDPQNNQPIKSAVSIVGGSYEFPKNQNKDFRNESLSGTMSLDNFALSGWVRATVNDAQDWHDYYGIKHANGGQLRFEANNNPPRIHVPSSVIVHPNLYSSNNPAGKLNADEWNHLVFSGSGGKLRLYMNGVLNTTADFQESAQVNGFYIAYANNNSAGIHDEVALHKIARHERWANATYKNQNTGSNYVNLGTFAGPPYFEDTETVIYAKKNVAIANFTPTVFGGGTLAYSAAGLPPGISINSSTGIISGTTDEVGDSTFTVTVTGANAAGAVRTTSKTYIIKVSDPDSFPLQVRFHTFGYAGSSTLNQFPVLLTFDSGITGFSYNSLASATAGDLRFYAANGEELPYEIETWTHQEFQEYGFVRIQFQELIR